MLNGRLRVCGDLGGGSSHCRINSGGATDLDLVPLEERGRGLTDPLVWRGKAERAGGGACSEVLKQISRSCSLHFYTISKNIIRISFRHAKMDSLTKTHRENMKKDFNLAEKQFCYFYSLYKPSKHLRENVI